MLISLWSLKGGSGCSVVSALLARAKAAVDPDGVLLVDLVGDQPHVFGCPAPDTPGVTDWLSAGECLPGGLGRVASDVGPAMRLAWRGHAGWEEAADVSPLITELSNFPATVVVDAGRMVGSSPRVGPAREVVQASTQSVLVTRACYLSLRRIAESRVAPSGVVLVSEPDRALGVDDIEQAVGAPVVAEVSIDPAVARAVDAGLLGARVPRALQRALQGVACGPGAR